MVFGFTLKEIRRKMVKQNVVFIFAFDCSKHPSLSLVNHTYTRTNKSNTLHFSIHIYVNICFFCELLFGKQFVAQWIRMEYIDTLKKRIKKKNVVKRKNVARMIGKYREKKKQWLNSKMWKSAHLTVSCCFFFFGMIGVLISQRQKNNWNCEIQRRIVNEDNVFLPHSVMMCRLQNHSVICVIRCAPLCTFPTYTHAAF